MALIKKAKVWHYDFWFKKKRYQGSTLQSNITKARIVQSKIKSDAALDLFGLGALKVAPMFRDFANSAFTKFVEQNSKEKPRTVKFYAEKVRRLLEWEPFAEARLTAIDEELIEKYKQHRATNNRRSRGNGKIAVGSINKELATLRKALRLAYEYRLIARVPKIRLLAGEGRRDYVLDGYTENRYLAAAPYPLKQVAILIIDLGFRPEELVSARKVDVSFERNDITITGKTGPRVLPLTTRAKETLDFVFATHEKSEWIFPGRRKGKHLTVWALDNLHAEVRTAGEFPAEFVLYSCRHTFGTRLAESGADSHAIKKLMGHSSVTTSEKYIHPGSEHIERAMRRKELLDQALRGEVEAQEDTSGVERR